MVSEILNLFGGFLDSVYLTANPSIAELSKGGSFVRAESDSESILWKASSIEMTSLSGDNLLLRVISIASTSGMK
jgi:hypothetical protein